MNRALLAVMRAANALAVGGHMLAVERRTQSADPAHETRFKLLCVEQRKDPSKRVVLGNPIGKRKMLAQPVEFHLASLDHRDPTLGPADDGANRCQQQFFQLISAFACTWVAQLLERLQQ